MPKRKLPGSVYVEARPNGSFRLRVIHPQLTKPFYAPFESRDSAQVYGDAMLANLRAGIVPDALKDRAVQPGEALVTKAAVPSIDRSSSLVKLILAYKNGVAHAPSDGPVLNLLVDMEPVKAATVADVLTVKWVDDFVRYLKLALHLAPSTLRKRVESLARAVDWHLRKTTPDHITPPRNPLRALPRNYSAPSENDKDALRKAGKAVKEDTERDRRLLAVEDECIKSALRGETLPGHDAPVWAYDPEFELLYLIISNLGLRLFEAYRMELADVKFTDETIRVRGSKGHYGVILWRDVPIKDEVVAALLKWHATRKLAGAVRLFSFWDGEAKSRPNTTAALSKRFRKLFDYCGVFDCTEHDLRHEATCRWISMRNSRGEWMFSDTEICKIMGWHGVSAGTMLLRYASLRASDLAKKMRA